jgi:uncharacterized protein (DUF1778 family)
MNKIEAKAPRVARLGFRATSNQEALIRKAAGITGMNVTQFVLSSACEAAENILMDQRVFFASDKAFQAFQAALERPTKVNSRLKKLLRSKAPWEK